MVRDGLKNEESACESVIQGYYGGGASSQYLRVDESEQTTVSRNPKKTEFMVIGHPLKTRNLNLP